MGSSKSNTSTTTSSRTSQHGTSNKAQRPIPFHLPNVFRQEFIIKANTVPNLDEMFQQTHPHNETSLSFLDKYSWKTPEQFSLILSQEKFKSGSSSSNDASQANIDDEDIFNNLLRLMDMEEKHKRQLYEIGQLDAQDTVGRGSLNHQPPISKNTDPSYDELRQQMQACEQTSQNSDKDYNSGQQQMTVSNISSAASSGFVIRISMFVVPLCLTVAWILGIQMNLNFKLLNTSSVALAIITLITSIFPLQDGTSHYLKGLVIFLCFIVIGACLF